MAERGGYRKPGKPAAVSGPGKFSQRTDGGVSQPARPMTGGGYGENAEMANLQSSAPMSASARMPQGEAPQGPPSGPPAGPVTPFDAPTARPDEPVTAGNPLGPGPGPAGGGMSVERLSSLLRQVAAQNPDGALDDLVIAMEEAGL